MTSVKSLRHWVTLRIKRPHIWTQPTQYQILSEILKSEFPGNWIKLFIFPDSASLTKSVLIFGNEKNSHTNKLCRILFPKFNLNIRLSSTMLHRPCKPFPR